MISFEEVENEKEDWLGNKHSYIAICTHPEKTSKIRLWLLAIGVPVDSLFVKTQEHHCCHNNQKEHDKVRNCHVQYMDALKTLHFWKICKYLNAILNFALRKT